MLRSMAGHVTRGACCKPLVWLPGLPYVVKGGEGHYEGDRVLCGEKMQITNAKRTTKDLERAHARPTSDRCVTVARWKRRHGKR